MGAGVADHRKGGMMEGRTEGGAVSRLLPHMHQLATSVATVMKCLRHSVPSCYYFLWFCIFVTYFVFGCTGSWLRHAGSCCGMSLSLVECVGLVCPTACGI